MMNGTIDGHFFCLIDLLKMCILHDYVILKGININFVIWALEPVFLFKYTIAAFVWSTL